MLENQIRQNIKQVLETVTTKNAPKVYALIQTVEGYKKVEDKIIRMMIDNNFTASGCIIPIESNL